MRRIFSVLLLCLFLVGCHAAPPTEPAPLTEEVATYQGEGFRLTYPACFSLARETGDMLSFTAQGRNMVFSLTWEENGYGAHAIEEYPTLMGIYEDVTVLDAHSFAVEKYLPDVLSGYYRYTVTEDTVYLLEYNYGGSEEERAMQSLFFMDVE